MKLCKQILHVAPGLEHEQDGAGYAIFDPRYVAYTTHLPCLCSRFSFSSRRCVPPYRCHRCVPYRCRKRLEMVFNLIKLCFNTGEQGNARRDRGVLYPGTARPVPLPPGHRRSTAAPALGVAGGEAGLGADEEGVLAGSEGQRAPGARAGRCHPRAGAQQ